MKSKMSLFLVFVLAAIAILLWSPITQAADVDAFIRAGYPVSSDVEDTGAFTLTVHPDYMIESEAGITVAETIRTYVGFDAVENLSNTYIAGLELYLFKTPVGVFAEYKRFDMKSGLPDYELAWAGLTFRFNTK